MKITTYLLTTEVDGDREIGSFPNAEARQHFLLALLLTLGRLNKVNADKVEAAVGATRTDINNAHDAWELVRSDSLDCLWIDEVETDVAPTDADLIDAERWRAVMSSQRMHFMGSAGFEHGNPADPSDRKIQNAVSSIKAKPGEEWLHFGMEFWNIHNAYGKPEFPDRFERQLFTLYADYLRANPPGAGTANPPAAGPIQQWPCRLMLDLSVEHLSQQEANILWAGAHADGGFKHVLTATEDRANPSFVIVNVPPVIDGEDMLDHWPVNLKRIGLYARQQGCDFVKIDVDGDIVSGLPTREDF